MAWFLFRAVFVYAIFFSSVTPKNLPKNKEVTLENSSYVNTEREGDPTVVEQWDLGPSGSLDLSQWWLVVPRWLPCVISFAFSQAAVPHNPAYFSI